MEVSLQSLGGEKNRESQELKISHGDHDAGKIGRVWQGANVRTENKKQQSCQFNSIYWALSGARQGPDDSILIKT